MVGGVVGESECGLGYSWKFCIGRWLVFYVLWKWEIGGGVCSRGKWVWLGLKLEVTVGGFVMGGG